jgi:hypothetical protein
LMLSAVCCWNSMLLWGNSVGYDLWMLSTFLLLDQRPGVFIRLIVCWVSSEFSGVKALCGDPSDFGSWGGSRCWVFWDETCRMVSLQWLEPSECFWRGSMVGGADVCFWVTCRWHWYHSLFVTIVWFLGSLMAQGFVLWRCRKNRKPRLDFSSRCLTSFEAGLWTHQYCWVRRVTWILFQIY